MADPFLFYKGIFQKGAEMKKFLFLSFIIPFILLSLAGCVPLIIGGAAGALGAYAVSKDTIQGETDKPYDLLWDAALMVSRVRGTVKTEDRLRGYIELTVGTSKAYIRLIKFTQTTVRLRVSARKYHLPDLSLAEDIFIKIMEQAR